MRIERRKTIRIDGNLKVSYKVISPPDGAGKVPSENISEGGICMPTGQRLQEGMVLELKISLLEYSRPIIATGEVMWLEKKEDTHMPYRMGIRFISIDPADKEKIFTYIRNKATQERKSDLDWLD